MNGTKFIFDTNTVLYLLGGKINTGSLPAGDYAVSFVTELELLSYHGITVEEENKIKDLMKVLKIYDLSNDIKKNTIDLRKRYRLRLPDAIVCATAIQRNASLLSFDKTLKKVDELHLIRVPLIS